MSFSLTNKKSVGFVAYELLERLDIKISKSLFFLNLSKIPVNQDSLLAIKHLFSTTKIDNVLVSLKRNELDKISDLSFPFITTIKEEFEITPALITKFQNDIVEFENYKGKLAEPWEEFKKKWTGIALMVFPSEEILKNAQSKKWTLNVEFLFKIAAIVALLGILFLSHSSSSSWVIPSLFLLKIVGLFVSILLITNDYNKTNSIIQRICLAQQIQIVIKFWILMPPNFLAFLNFPMQVLCILQAHFCI